MHENLIRAHIDPYHSYLLVRDKNGLVQFCQLIKQLSILAKAF